MPVPKAWPPSVTYLTQPRYSTGLSQAALATIRRPAEHSEHPQCAAASLPTEGPCALVRISNISNPHHPACGEAGLFAAVALKPSSPIVFYMGLVHGSEETNEDSSYDLSLDRDSGIAIDATDMGNEARFINDYRGVRAEGPNAEFRDCWVNVRRNGAKQEVISEKRIGVYVMSAGKSGGRSKGIQKGEEILVTYGKGFWEGRHPRPTSEGET